MKLVAVIGSRTFKAYKMLEDVLDRHEIDKIVSGGARGADALAARYAKERKIELLEILPDYYAHGHQAPLERNKTIVHKADYIIAFWDGESRGTKYTLDYAASIGKKGIIINVTTGGNNG